VSTVYNVAWSRILYTEDIDFDVTASPNMNARLLIIINPLKSDIDANYI